MPPQIRQGQYWWVADDAIVFPEERGREPHATSRGCIVVEGDASLARGGARVLVVPTSSQTDRKDTYDVIIPHPPAPNRECVALMEHVQPILRADLANLVCPLPQEWTDKVVAALLLVLGVEAVEESEEDQDDDDAF